MTWQGLIQVKHIKSQSAQAQVILASQKVNSRQRQSYTSTNGTLFRKTLAYFVARKKQGCGAPLLEETRYSEVEMQQREAWLGQQDRARRGHAARPTCAGRLLFRHNIDGRAFIMCEHYSRRENRDHLIDYSVGQGLYDTEYLEALFSDDDDLVAAFERDGLAASGGGPMGICTTVANFSTIKVSCDNEHRNESGELVILPLQHLECTSKFRSGEHSHVIPISTKTPPHIRADVFGLLRTLDQDVPDLTTRRFLRHPSTLAFLRDRLPDIENPTLLDLHPSLANRDHVRAYILQVQKEMFPRGTGWDGLLYLKERQDVDLLPEDAYIRFVEEYPAETIGTDEDGDDADETEADTEAPFRIVICMTLEGSRRLVRAQFLQSDISFRRIIGFKEFELGGMEQDSRTSIVYCRIYVNRQTAVAHQIIFQKIHDIVVKDTGENLQWRHIHSQTPDEEVGVLHFVLDQHGGQAKGLGLYLRALAQQLPGKYDLAQPTRLLSSLDEYEHLSRVARLCTAHIYRNIRKSNVPESVRNLMRGLVCIEHPDWDNTVERIRVEGGRADWVADKIRSKFAFAAMCWEKSHIPKSIWQVGDSTSNIIESSHADANREGISCTLVGGVKKGLHLDSLKMKTLYNRELHGVRPLYARGHISESTTKSLKRKAALHHQHLARADAKIEGQNKRVRTAYDALVLAHHRLFALQQGAGSQAQLTRAVQAVGHADDAYTKAGAASAQLVGSGSGKVQPLLPYHAPQASVQ
ncbi:hypothetical protein GGX14DRAFT_546454 [Mycena pura]|uniref:Uncharacterized protein n=1 Tax=Mycena pura TaxID=153505 RepID=A0AAD6UR52_9AGAR|nr:hypothetical protein GGX14DRAFT_546454 [Mycena pura]